MNRCHAILPFPLYSVPAALVRGSLLLVCHAWLTGCESWVSFNPLLDLASDLQRAASELTREAPGTRSVVRQHMSVESSSVIIVAPAALDFAELEKVAAPFIEPLKRAKPEWSYRPFVVLSSLEHAESTPLEGVVVPRQLFVVKRPGRHDIVVTLKKERDQVVLEKLE